MTITYTYPTSNKLIAIEQDLVPALIEDDPILKPGGAFPIENEDYHLLSWEIRDNFEGLQQLRGLNGAPSRVVRAGVNRFQCQPGVYGDYDVVDETDLTIARDIGTFGTPIRLDDLIYPIQLDLLMKRLNRIRTIIWSLLTTGTFSVATATGMGGIVHTDSYTFTSLTPTYQWSNLANATPIQDLRSILPYQRGHSVSFGPGAIAYANVQTITNLLNNTNASDLQKVRQGTDTVNNLTNMNQLLAGNGLPTLEVYDNGYIDTTGTFQNFIPLGKVVIIGKRTTGMKVGNYRMTRNANNPNGKPGPYTFVIDRGAGSDRGAVPRTIEVHDGHNGGPVCYYPSSIIILNV